MFPGGCDGPHKEDADKKGDEAFDDVMQLLKEKYRVTGAIPGQPSWPGMDESFNENKEALRKALREIIFTQDCIDW